MEHVLKKRTDFYLLRQASPVENNPKISGIINWVTNTIIFFTRKDYNDFIV